MISLLIIFMIVEYNTSDRLIIQPSKLGVISTVVFLKLLIMLIYIIQTRHLVFSEESTRLKIYLTLAYRTFHTDPNEKIDFE